MKLLGKIVVNFALALLLVLMFVQTLPGVPDSLVWYASWFANRTCVAQHGWSMFAPDPDSMNHHIRAVIRYWDGRTVTWDAPEWKERTLWRKFTGARELEYFDSIEAAFNEPALEGFADYLARTHRENAELVGRPKRVEIWIDIYNHNHPDRDGWRPLSGKIPLTRSSLMWERDYP
jgi:hypothetical protein